MKTPEQAGESVIKKGPANLQKGLEAVGGKLFLTNQRLVFEAHALNIQRENLAVALCGIKSVHPSWTRFLRIPLFPNSITIELQEGKILEFVVYGRKGWVSEISRFAQAEMPCSGPCQS